jgi:membrane associated rhomboid family serine protease/antitoxin component YwqK of YwqJK toxin-antitoxin module
MDSSKKFPATLILLATNAVVFAYCRYTIGTFDDPIWTQGLLFRGAEFAPLTLDKEWYRLFTHMFLHGNIMHLLFNMYALFTVGREVEQTTGTPKFLWIYFLSGFGASLASLYFNLFAVGVGASGAIFGLFGFSLVVQIAESRKSDHPVAPIIINFFIFLGINIFFAKALNADTSAHLGGLACGLIMGLLTLMQPTYHILKAELLLLPVCLYLFFALPRYPVTYFNFFQKILTIEDSTRALYDVPNLTNEKFLERYQQYNMQWDTALVLLQAHTYLPEQLHADTFKLTRYITFNKKESDFRIKMIADESYRYLDSIEWAQQQRQPYSQLDYVLTQLQPIKPDTKKRDTTNLIPVEVWYNEDWEELPGPPGAYYRRGMQDSLGRWQGALRDYYSDGTVQMKGVYKNSQRDGVFIYYSNHNTYTSAGRYVDERSVGKWETFHDNGRLKSEEYFLDKYYMKNMWDTAGYFLVKDGEGRFTERYANGVISETGLYKEGRREGVWEGRHKNGSLYFEEFYNEGRLVSGRSRLLDGQTFVYDASSFYPMPEGGNAKLVSYLKTKVAQANPAQHGKVVLAFRVSVHGVLSDFLVEKSAAPQLDALAIEFIKTGPQWIPAREHGHQYQPGWGWVTVEF